MDVNEYSIEIENGEYVIDIGDTPVTTLITRSRMIPVPNGSDTVSWTFATALTGVVTDYVPQVSVLNTADSFPQDLIAHVSSFNTSTIQAKLNAVTDTGNYYICISVFPKWDV